ncbi:MAG: serine/threonine phosphatase [Candidatus Sumerlaea sp.]|nr:MAG: serine/threonine phosphatase [Candidatus Sumerlaea sp.]
MQRLFRWGTIARRVMNDQSVRFLQFSDLHLDSRLSSSRLCLPATKRSIRQRETLRFLDSLPELVREHRVQVVLCPGDLWDEESVSLETVTHLFDAFEKLAPVPVILAPGNHDFYHDCSYYEPGYYERKTGRRHPSNVRVFTSPVVESLRIPELPHVDFYGCCFEHNVPQTERILAGLQRLNRPENLNVLLLHGSLDDRLAVQRSGKDLTNPFSREELLASPFDYVALGHYHRYITIAGSDGCVRGAYGGIPLARGLDETDEHYVLVGEIRKGGVPSTEFKEISVDPRRIWRITVALDRSITNSRATFERIAAEFRRQGVGKDDMVFIELEGLVHPDTEAFFFDSQDFESLCFHAVVDQSKLEPDYDLASILADEASSKQVVGQFVRQMKEEIESAKDDAQKQILRAALLYGLDALNGKPIRRRYVDSKH